MKTVKFLKDSEHGKKDEVRKVTSRAAHNLVHAKEARIVKSDNEESSDTKAK